MQHFNPGFSYFSIQQQVPFDFERSFLNNLSSMLEEDGESGMLSQEQSQLQSQGPVIEEEVDEQEFEQQLKQDSVLEPQRKKKLQKQLQKQLQLEEQKAHSGSESESENTTQNSSSQNSSQLSGSQLSGSQDKSNDSESEDEDSAIFVSLQNKKKLGKVVPIVSRPKQSAARKVSKTQDVKEVEIPDSESDQDVTDDDMDNDNTNELESLVKQLVLLESEETKAKQFLEYIQLHSCFDKQDHNFVRQFLDQIANEKQSLVVVLNNYGAHLQPLITMITITERRLALLDNTNLISPGSTLHALFLDKQQSLQSIVTQATSQFFPSQR
jgi:hypothetical protein